MVVPVDPEDGEGLSGHVGALLQPVCLDDGADARAEPLHLHLQLTRHASLRQTLQGGAGEAAVVPQPAGEYKTLQVIKLIK